MRTVATVDDVLRLRLRRQLVEAPAAVGDGAPGATSPEDVVARLTAIQAQDYAGALWSIGLSGSPETTLADVETAIAERRIVRTWPMRGTLHFVMAGDVRWMLALLAPRVVARAAGRQAQLGLNDDDVARAGELLADALAGGGAVTRAEAMALLEQDGIATSGQRGYHILWDLAQHGLLCLGRMSGRQQTFVLLDEWIPPDADAAPAPGRDEALGRLAGRYLEAHGPATVADLAWWAGITKTEARAGIESISASLECITIGGTDYLVPRTAAEGAAGAPGLPDPAAPAVHLLPGFDEYMLGYTDRAPQLGEHRETYGTSVAANGMFAATLVIDGRIAGTWKRTLTPERVEVALRPFRELDPPERKALAAAVERYGRFLGKDAVVV